MGRNPVFSESPAAEGQLDLSALAEMLWRRRRWIVIPILIAAAITAVTVNAVTPRYKSEARILIESRETPYNRPEGDRSGERDRPLLDAEAVQSQVQLALSRDLARKVVREFKLSERREFNPLTGGAILEGFLDLIGLASATSRRSLEERVLEHYYDRLSVFQVERSRVIAIEFRSYDPDLAANVANAVAEEYLAVQQAGKRDAMQQASQWLAGEIDGLRSKVAEAEARVEEFRAKANLYVGSNNNPLSAQQLAELNSQLVLARTQKAEAESKARLIRQMLRAGQPIEASEIVNSELIRRLNEQRVTLRAQLAEQSSTLLSQHPRIKELKAQIADLEAQTRIEGEKLVRSLENDAKISGARVETLTATLDQVKRQASVLGGQDVQLRALEREAKAQRDLLESYLSRYRDVSARETPDAVPPDARVVSRAVPAASPYFPKKLPITLLATLATFLCATTFMAVGELLRGGIPGREARPPAREMPVTLPPQVPVAPVADAPIAQPSEPPPAPPIVDVPAKRQEQLGTLADHVRTIGRGIVVVTRAGGSERSGNIAIELARELAGQGAGVLLIDLETTVAAAGLVPGTHPAGLADLVYGAASYAEVIQRDPASRLHVIALGRGAGDMGALLSAPKLAIVFGALSQTYDHVIVAAPAIIRIPEADRLARFSRCVVLITAERDDGSGVGACAALESKGFSNVILVTVNPPGDFSGRVAA